MVREYRLLKVLLDDGCIGKLVRGSRNREVETVPLEASRSSLSNLLLALWGIVSAVWVTYGSEYCYLRFGRY